MPMLSRRAVLEGGAAVAAALAHADVLAASAAAGPTPRKRLWYRQPASVWTEALPVGNGRLGAMVFGGAGTETLQLNEDTLWTGGSYDPTNPLAHDALPEVRRLIAAGKFAEAEALANARLMGTPKTQMAYQSVGELILRLSDGGGQPVEYERELDLDSAVATTRFTLDGVGYRREVFASAPDQVVAVRMTADRPFDLSVDLQSAQPGLERSASGKSLLMTGRNAERAGVAGALRFAARARVAAQGGTVRAESAGLRVRGARRVTVLLAMATSYRRFDDVSGDPERLTLDTLDAAAGQAFERLHARSVADHQALFRRVQLDLGQSKGAELPTDLRIHANPTQDDPGLAGLYFDYGRYLLIASSRKGSQPANLQGIWNDSNKPAWESKYTVNINTEMNYWPAQVAALPECVDPLIAMVHDLSVTGAKVARTMYGARGWVCHHNTDLWRAAAPIDGAQWGLWPTGGAWLCTHLWEHYDYSRDLGFLGQAYPLMKGAALFFIDTLQRDAASGRLVTSPSLSPENVHPFGASICAGPAMDQQILRDLFDQVAQAASILGEDAAFAATVRRTRAQLAPDHIGADGRLQEWQGDWDAKAPEPNHRHLSHLYGLFPSEQIAVDRTPALAEAARRSLVARGDESTGWATAWRANLWARLRDGEHAHRILTFLLGPDLTYPNMFDAHPPFQIDGNFGGTRAVAEMLMQSREDELLLLPALPRAWATGSVSGLRARGACTVDLRWRGGTLEEVVIAGRVAGKRRVRLGSRQAEVELVPGRPARLRGADLVRG